MSSSINTSQSSARSSNHQYTADKIRFRLQHEKSNFKILNNDSPIFKSKCWCVFGFPAKKDENDNYERIHGFVSCQKCLKTYAHINTTGTRHLNSHLCVTQYLTESKSSTSASTQITLEQISKDFKQIKLSDKEVTNFKSLMANWICGDLRPFTVSEDIGLRKVFQELISLGAKYGNFDVTNIARGPDTLSNYIYDLADQYRSNLKEILKEPFDNEAICISPDMWSDRHKQISYLGLSCTFVDADLNFKTLDLCCRPYQEVDQSGDNLLLAIQKALEVFNLNDLSQLNFVTDRGPNLVKALKPYKPIYCYGHRLNNVLKRSFFQVQNKKKKETVDAPTSTIEVNKKGKDSDLSASSSEEDIELTLPVKKKKKKTQVLAATAQPVTTDPRKLHFDDLDSSAKKVIETIINCKKLVKYVKKAGLNKEIQSGGGIALQQATVVRWLSLIALLESVLKSYKETKRVLTSRKQQSKLAGIDAKIVEGLIHLLKPFKTTLKLIQNGTSPSLYMVLIYTLNLRKTLSTYKNLLSSVTSFDNTDEGHSSATDDSIEDMIEHEGLQIIRERILELLDLMFELDIRHYVATMLHPKYRQLRGCSKEERSEACKFIREEMTKIIRHDRSNQSFIIEPSNKKQKTEKSILEQYEDTSENESDLSKQQDGDIDDNVPVHTCSKPDELTKYLEMYIDRSTLTQNPLVFWKANQTTFPILTRVARKIHCIPATSAAVERQFSGAGIVLNERRTCLNPEHLDDILFIRTMKNIT